MAKNFFTKESNLSQFLLIYKLLRESLPSKINFSYSKLELSKRNTRGCIFKSKNLSEINWLLPRFKSRVTKEDVRLQIIAFSHTHINKYQKWKTLKAPLSPSSRIRIAKTRGKNREARMESKVIVGSRIKISRPRHRKRQNYYSINPYTRDLARTSGGLSRRSPRKLQQREKRGPAALFRELFFSFLARPPGTEPTRRAPWDLVAILLSRVRAPLDIPRTLYISPISPLLSFPPPSSPLFLRLPLSLLSLPTSAWHGETTARGGGGLQIIWNFPFDAEESPQGSFSARDSQTNDRFRRYFWSLFWARCYINTFRFSTIRFSMDFSYSMILTLL